jgi:hypothetical protein
MTYHKKKSIDTKNSILVDLVKVNDFNMHQLAKRHKIANFSNHQRDNTSEKRIFGYRKDIWTTRLPR